MTASDRDNLARQQQQALQAVLRKGPAPAGMEPAQVEHTANVLQSKRRHEARLAAPRLADSLGDTFAEKFDYYARQVSYPARGGPAADAAGFGDHLRARRQLPDSAEFEHLMLKARTQRPIQCRVIGSWAVLMIRVRGRVRVFRVYLRNSGNAPAKPPS